MCSLQFVGLYGITSIEILLTGMPCFSISFCSHPVSTAANTSGISGFDSITCARARTHTHTHTISLCQSPVLWF